MVSFHLVGGADVSTAPLTIPQPNWGVMFNRVGTILNGITRYRHSFAIPWPNINKPNLQPFKCDTHILYIEDCNRINQFIQDINRRLDEKVQNMLQRLKIEEDNMNHATYNFQKHRVKRDTGHALGDDYCDKMSSDQSIDSSSLLSEIGSVASDLFGTPTSGDIKAIASHICSIAKLSELDQKQIHESNDRLTSMSNAISDRITNLKGGITDAENRIQSLNKNFNQIIKETDNIVNQLEKRLSKLEGMNALLLELMNGLNRIEQLLNTMEMTVDQWVFALKTLTDGRLPVFLVSKEDILNVLDHIRENILPLYGDEFMITHENPLFYYKLPSLVSYTKTNNYLLIMLTIPINTVGGLLPIYKVDVTHVSLSLNDSSSTLFHKLPDFFATTSDAEYYLEMDVSQFSSCKGDILKICPSEQSLRRSNQKSCAASIFYDSARDVMNKCDIRFEEVHKMIKSGYAKQIYEHHYFVHSAKDNEPWTLTCSQASTGYNIQRVESCNSCIIKVPCFCKLMAPDFVIPEQLCEMKDPGHPQVTYKYGVNLPALHSLFDPSVLTAIKGNSLDEKDKWNIQLPKLFISNSSSTFDKTVIQKDNIYASDFKKLMNHHKEQTVAYATKADLLLKKAEDFSDLSNSHLKDIQNLMGGSWFSNFFNANTMIGGVSLSLIFSGISIIFCIYTCCMNSRR